MQNTSEGLTKEDLAGEKQNHILAKYPKKMEAYGTKPPIAFGEGTITVRARSGKEEVASEARPAIFGDEDDATILVEGEGTSLTLTPEEAYKVAVEGVNMISEKLGEENMEELSKSVLSGENEIVTALHETGLFDKLGDRREEVGFCLGVLESLKETLNAEVTEEARDTLSLGEVAFINALMGTG